MPGLTETAGTQEMATIMNPNSCAIQHVNNSYMYGEASYTMQDLTNEAARLKSFSNWPNKNMPPHLLAKAGFFYLQKNDAVECPFCGVQGHKWKSGDNPLRDHKIWAPNCYFVRSYYNQISRDQFNPQLLDSENDLDSDDETSNYLTLEKRLESFKNWPKSLRQKPVELAEAGFYYINVGDQTLCFECGGGVKDWEENDEPWEQHALWYPNCKYLLLNKGKEFVKQVQDKFMNEDK